MKDLIEPDFAEPYQAWRAANNAPEANAAILDTLHPVIEGAARTHVGNTNPLILSRARQMALASLRTYDPKRSRLGTHLYNQLRGLKRVQSQQGTILKVPQRLAFDHYHLDQAEREITQELGREPTDDELADRTGFSPRRMARVRSYHPAAAEGTFEQASGASVGTQNPVAAGHSAWMNLVYDDLDAYHKKVMEHTLGLHGRRTLSNAALATKLNRSPGAISQAKLRIQQMLDEEHALSPFGG